MTTVPDIDLRYWCGTCGSVSGECCPDTGFCFHCGADNWEPHPEEAERVALERDKPVPYRFDTLELIDWLKRHPLKVLRERIECLSEHPWRKENHFFLWYRYNPETRKLEQSRKDDPFDWGYSDYEKISYDTKLYMDVEYEEEWNKRKLLKHKEP